MDSGSEFFEFFLIDKHGTLDKAMRSQDAKMQEWGSDTEKEIIRVSGN